MCVAEKRLNGWHRQQVRASNMGLFSRKKEKTEESGNNLNVMTELARNKVMKQATAAVTASYKSGRLVFNNKGDAEYTDKNGLTQVYTLDELASLFWDKMNSKLAIATTWVSGVQANLAILDISVKDILKIILGLKGETV